MQNKFQNKYRITSTRLQSWDYSNNGAYFITICTQNRKHFFGEIQNGFMHLSEIGELAELCWLMIPKNFSFVELGNFVVMPNHVHGIIIINNVPNSVETRFIASKNIQGTDETRLIASKIVEKTYETIDETIEKTIEKTIDETTDEARLIAPLHVGFGGFSGDKNPMINDNISKIIRWYKGRCSFESRKMNPNFGWQSRFHDHIIRNSKSFNIIQNYIFENPLNWKEDTFNK